MLLSTKFMGRRASCDAREYESRFHIGVMVGFVPVLRDLIEEPADEPIGRATSCSHSSPVA